MSRIGRMPIAVPAGVTALVKNGGSLGFNDKADPEIIKKHFDMSKNAFKRAVGRLLKQGKVIITEDSIIINEKNK